VREREQHSGTGQRVCDLFDADLYANNFSAE
jgi:hypothetical protein